MTIHEQAPRGGALVRSRLALMTGRSRTADLVLAAVALIVFRFPPDIGVGGASDLAICLAAVAVALRRMIPAGALLAAIGLGVVQVWGRERPALVDVAFMIVIATVAVVGTRLELAVAAVLAVVGGVSATAYLAVTGARYAELLGGPTDQAALVAVAPAAALTVAWAIGLALRALAAQRRESTMRRAAESVATRAVDEADVARVRSAIARDVHDIVGHSLTVIIAQADSVAFLTDEEQIRDANATIARTARASLLEVREVLGDVRSASDAGPDSLEAVVDRVREAGVGVDLQVRGRARLIDAATATVARRVLQEMLTNAMRHGRTGRPIAVTVAWRSQDLVIEAENDVDGQGSSEPGSGIAGMRTRVVAAGGAFETASIDDTFIARARIPLGSSTLGVAP